MIKLENPTVPRDICWEMLSVKLWIDMFLRYQLHGISFSISLSAAESKHSSIIIEWWWKFYLFVCVQLHELRQGIWALCVAEKIPVGSCWGTRQSNSDDTIHSLESFRHPPSNRVSHNKICDSEIGIPTSCIYSSRNSFYVVREREAASKEAEVERNHFWKLV